MPGRIIGNAIVTLVLLLLEAILTMVVYTLLNLYAFDTFGYLVRLSRGVLDVMANVILAVLPGSANSVYATLLGELGPKAILLLLLGLVVAAVVRGLVAAMGLNGRRA